jgi:hypothetical protein
VFATQEDSVGHWTQHRVAAFQEGFMVVTVERPDVQRFGEMTIFEMIATHDWIVDQGIPVVIAYELEDGSTPVYGDLGIVNALEYVDPDSIPWTSLQLEW